MIMLLCTVLRVTVLHVCSSFKAFLALGRSVPKCGRGNFQRRRAVPSTPYRGYDHSIDHMVQTVEGSSVDAANKCLQQQLWIIRRDGHRGDERPEQVKDGRTTYEASSSFNYVSAMSSRPSSGNGNELREKHKGEARFSKGCLAGWKPSLSSYTGLCVTLECISMLLIR